MDYFSCSPLNNSFYIEKTCKRLPENSEYAEMRHGDVILTLHWRHESAWGQRAAVRNGNHDLVCQKMIDISLLTGPEDNEELEPLFIQEPDVHNNVDFFNPALQKTVGTRVCVETNFPGIFRCHRYVCLPGFLS